MTDQQKIAEALKILAALGLPRAQQNERSALCLLALLNIGPNTKWAKADNPLLGITPIMDWVRKHYGKNYAPNTRETVRRQTMHQFVDAGIAIYNPDDPSRAVNSPNAVYQIEPETLALLRTYGSRSWKKELAGYLVQRTSLVARYARERNLQRVPVRLSLGQSIDLSPGEHSKLIKEIIENFAPRFVPDAALIYVGDTGDKWSYFDEQLLKNLGVVVDSHGKMPDVVIYCPKRAWLLLIESVTSHGPVNGKRHDELARLFAGSSAGLVYVTAFPTRATMSRHLGDVAWETEVWVADAPSHLIHFNGVRFLGPYNQH